MFMNPLVYVEDDEWREGLMMTDVVDARANFIPLEDIIKGMSPDYYVAIRDFYLKRRQNLIDNNEGDGDSDELYQELLSQSE